MKTNQVWSSQDGEEYVEYLYTNDIRHTRDKRKTIPLD